MALLQVVNGGGYLGSGASEVEIRITLRKFQHCLQDNGGGSHDCVAATVESVPGLHDASTRGDSVYMPPI